MKYVDLKEELIKVAKRIAINSESVRYVVRINGSYYIVTAPCNYEVVYSTETGE